MNRLTIPALLVATIMVAGAFAFMPVEQASTVHTSDQFEGNSIVKTETTLDLTLTTRTGSGQITFSVAADEGLFQIKQLILCNVDLSGAGKIAFAVNTAIVDVGTGTLVDNQTDFFDTNMQVGEGLCTDLLVAATDNEIDAGLIQLRGDGNNDVVILFKNYSGNDADGSGTLIAYVSGVSDASEIDIAVDFGDFNR